MLFINNTSTNKSRKVFKLHSSSEPPSVFCGVISSFHQNYSHINLGYMACLHKQKEKKIIKLLWQQFQRNGRRISRGTGDKCQLGFETWPSHLLRHFSPLHVFSHPILQLYFLLVSTLYPSFRVFETVLGWEHVITIIFTFSRHIKHLAYYDACMHTLTFSSFLDLSLWF